MTRPAFSWLNKVSREFLSMDYLVNRQTPEHRISYMATVAERRLGKLGFAQKFYDYMSRGWYSIASPIWTNYGLDRGLPISCFGSYIQDSMESILATHAEIGMMSKFGGGTSAYMGNIRGRGSEIKDNGTSHGSHHFARLFDLEITIISQGSSRRGQCACYWPIDHPDIEEVLEIMMPGNLIQKLSYGVCVPDAWMEDMIAGNERKRTVWAKVIKARRAHGYPYLFFTDNVNRQAPKEYAELGLTINHSNLCTEIALSNGPDESFVCCVSSMNDLYFDEWDGTDAVETLVYFLDTVISEFVDKAKGKYGMERAVRFAENQRALGIGQLGWHSYLQSKMIPFESAEAGRENVRIAKSIRKSADAASERMAAEYGEPPSLKGRGRRHMTKLALAPTKSSSTILGQMSENTEPFVDNYGVKDNQKLKYTFRNPKLEQVLAAKGVDVEAEMMRVLKDGGSVRSLTCLDAHEKDVFKTFGEISPAEIINQAAQRQPHIDQSQSINLWIDPSVSAKDVNALYIHAWRSGLKTLYYQKNENAAQQLARSIMSCSSCEG